MLKIYFALGLIALAPSLSTAAEFIYDTANGQRYSLVEFAHARVRSEILVLGESHANQGQENDPSTIVHHRNQARLLETLTEESRARSSMDNFHVTTAMEFLDYTKQAFADSYLNGAISETDFLRLVGWSSSNPFEFYRAQILEPARTGGRIVALNIPRSISGHVAQLGPEGLSAPERALLPPIWERGGDLYFQRFQVVMEEGGHIPAEAVERYFWAQSLWDDTMAWNTLKNLIADPLAVTVIIVGEFHVDFGHGLPARLRRQQAGVAVKTILQVEAPNLEAATVAPLLLPGQVYGVHADYLWLHTL